MQLLKEARIKKSERQTMVGKWGEEWPNYGTACFFGGQAGPLDNHIMNPAP